MTLHFFIKNFLEKLKFDMENVDIKGIIESDKK